MLTIHHGFAFEVVSRVKLTWYLHTVGGHPLGVGVWVGVGQNFLGQKKSFSYFGLKQREKKFESDPSTPREYQNNFTL